MSRHPDAFKAHPSLSTFDDGVSTVSLSEMLAHTVIREVSNTQAHGPLHGKGPDGLYRYGLYSYGLCMYGMHSYGLHNHGLHNNGLHSYGIYSHGFSTAGHWLYMFTRADTW